MYCLPRQNHVENKDKEIRGMKLSINAITIVRNVPFCISICDVQEGMHNDFYLQKLMEHITEGWPSN